MKQTVEEAAMESCVFDKSIYNEIYQPYYLDGFKSGAEWQAKQSPWIRAKSQLPQVDENDISCQSERVLVQLASKEWFEPVILIYNNHFNTWDSEDGDDAVCKVSDEDLWMPIPSFDEILEANKDVLQRIKEKGD